MDHTSSAPTSIWLASSRRPVFGSFQGPGRYDVAIIGAGIVGVCTAYFLRGQGLSVAVIDRERILAGVTAHTTAKLTSQHGLRYKRVIAAVGSERAQMYADANEWAISAVREISMTHKIDCDLIEDTATTYAVDPKHRHSVLDEVGASLELGLPAEFIEPAPLPYSTDCGVRFRGQARFHPLKFLSGLVEVVADGYADFFERTAVLQVDEVEGGCVVHTDGGSLQAGMVVVATHYPIHDSALFAARLAPYRSYVLAVDAPAPAPEGMFYGEEPPVRSLRRQPYEGRDVLLVGGENHKVGQQPHTDTCYQNLETWARRVLGAEKVLFRWSTQDNSTPDGIPYVGKAPRRERIFMATGFGGWGMSNGVASARLIADLILRGTSDWADVYSPARMDLAAVPRLVKENLNASKHLIGDRLARVQERDFADIGKDSAKVVQLENDRVAAYRDSDGDLHVVSATCTHWGCQVAWNPAERSWDCPCHGSRFSIDGHVLHSPATEPLALVEFAEGDPKPE